MDAGNTIDFHIWDRMDAARMQRVAAMEILGDAGGRLDFSAYASGVGELAWILEGSLMQQELWETATRQAGLQVLCPAAPAALEFRPDCARLELDDGQVLEAALVVGADGADSWTRQAAGIQVRFHPYHQHGVVANFACERDHLGTAWQWFREDGILAWLPLPGKRMSMVWSAPEALAQELVALPAEALCGRVAEAGGHRLGALEPVTPAAGFPLRLMRPPRRIGARLALVGDAAHAIHPLSGHGINLGFQDVRVLADILSSKPAHVDAGDERWLRRYERARSEEIVALQSVTHGLHRLFAPRHPVLSLLRNTGLNLTNRLPVLRDALVRYALG